MSASFILSSFFVQSSNHMNDVNGGGGRGIRNGFGGEVNAWKFSTMDPFFLCIFGPLGTRISVGHGWLPTLEEKDEGRKGRGGWMNGESKFPFNNDLLVVTRIDEVLLSFVH